MKDQIDIILRDINKLPPMSNVVIKVEVMFLNMEAAPKILAK